MTEKQSYEQAVMEHIFIYTDKLIRLFYSKLIIRFAYQKDDSDIRHSVSYLETIL